MKEKHFWGTCDIEQLRGFSFDVMGIRLFTGLPKDAVVLPASKKRKNCYVIFDATGSVIQPSQVVAIVSANCVAGFYPQSTVIRARWISRRRNEINVYRNGDLFTVYLVERTEDSHYRRMLERQNIKLSLRG